MRPVTIWSTRSRMWNWSSAIEEMSLDDAADLLEDMPAGVVKRVLEKSSKQTRESLNKLLNYPESSAGSLMTRNMSACARI